jgi:long-chain acyl-CoA synthetase
MQVLSSKLGLARTSQVGYKLMHTPSHWFEDEQVLSDWLWDLLMSTMKRIRPSYETPAFYPEIVLNRQQSGIDSIELVDLATQLFISLDTENSGAMHAHARSFGKLGNRYSDWRDFAALGARYAQSMRFQTSGSTGSGQWHAHALTHLHQEANVLAARFKAQHIERIVCMVPYNHLYGFIFGVLLPKALNVPIYKVHGLESSPPMIAELLNENDLLIANPRWLQSAQHSLFQAKRACHIVSSSQVLVDDYFAWAGSAGFTLWDIYGCTELAGIGLRNAAGSFRVFDRFKASTGANALVDTWTDTIRPALDYLQWTDAQHFFVTGRIDQAFQVAGHNIYPMELAGRIASVCEALCTLPAEQFQLRIRAWPEDATARVHVLIAINNDTAAQHLQTHLNAALQTSLRGFEMPASLTICRQLPMNDFGKESNWLQR